MKHICRLAAALLFLSHPAFLRAGTRAVISLDGQWQIAQGPMDQPPTLFPHQAPVPGLVDMATPPFADVGRKSPLRQAFWYRRTFSIPQPLPEVARLKIHKAQFGSQVWLNGRLIGEHLPCFTPAWFDVRPALRGQGQANELIIRVGADRDSLPQDMPTGWDFEKYLFIPGLYDSLELILSGAPYIVNVQTVPLIEQSAVRVVAEIAAGQKDRTVILQAAVTRRRSSTPDGRLTAPATAIAAGKTGLVDFIVPIRDCRLWSPETPNLYDLQLDTGADASRTRFGMRSFRFDRESQRALLNGKPYFLRGSNVTIQRFFEDAARGALPWDRQWVRRLHQQVKSMHWNALRYCIGFPPEFWYDIADEEGILIQDEFPIWLLNGPQSQCPEWPVAEKIIPQYVDWMRERWNHACVVIWDAQNESRTPETGKALQAVRRLDLSDRPWENGWAEPQAATDCVEAHPYLHQRAWNAGGKAFQMSEMAGLSGRPPLQKAQQAITRMPIIINEYGWLWLTRDGQPTCLTGNVYRQALGEQAGAAQRRLFWARTLAAKTEFWRARRECAGVLHFCVLGYSRPGDKPRPEGGATSDHWLDVRKLVFEPLFERFVKDAFAPTGLMIDFWAAELQGGERRQLPLILTNDLPRPRQGQVRLQLLRGGQIVARQSQRCHIDSLGSQKLIFPLSVPERAGQYTLQATLLIEGEPPVSSLRDIQVQ